MAAAEFPATFAEEEVQPRRTVRTYTESEEEKWRIGLHENTKRTTVRMAFRILWLETPMIRFSRRRHSVAAERLVVFILPWRDITAVSDAGISRQLRERIGLLANSEFLFS